MHVDLDERLRHGSVERLFTPKALHIKAQGKPTRREAATAPPWVGRRIKHHHNPNGVAQWLWNPVGVRLILLVTSTQGARRSAATLGFDV
jgi:hypothetical protein